MNGEKLFLHSYFS